jgi:hypothetical protein
LHTAGELERMSGMDDESRYRNRMSVTVIGVFLLIPLLLAILLLVLDFFFNPFRPW